MNTGIKTGGRECRASLIMSIGLLALYSGTATAQDEVKAPPPCFAPCSQLTGSRAMIDSPADASVGIEDFVVDTRDGMIAYALVDAHGVLGDTRRSVAVPYEALTWSTEKHRYELRVSKSQLSQLPEFDEGNMAYLNDANWISSVRAAFGDQQDLNDERRRFGDEYTLFFTKREPERIKGTITSVDENARTAMGDECLSLTVEPEEGDEQIVFVAPSDFMKNQKIDLSPGKEVEVTAVRAFDGKMQPVHVAQSVHCDGWQLRLRDEQGIPAWTTRDRPHHQTYYVLATDLNNGELFAGDVEFGSVKQTIIEMHSGTVAFSIVSTGDILNVNEILYPVPFQKLTVGADDHLVIDLPADELQVAPKLSRKGLDDLTHAGFVSRVLAYYGMDDKRAFDTSRASKWLAAAPTSGKGRPGQ